MKDRITVAVLSSAANSAKDVGSAMMKAGTASVMILSLASAVALVKIFQMMDYMLFFSVTLPKNFERFVDMIKSDLFSFVPNPFKSLTDDDCGEVREKFAENGQTCQFLSNSGNIFFLLILQLLFKFFVSMLARVFRQKNRLMTKAGLAINKFNNSFGVQTIVNAIDMYQLDFYIAAFLQFDSFEVRSGKSMYNIICGVGCFVSIMFMTIYVLFKSTRVAQVSKMALVGERSYKKSVYEFLFLKEGQRCNSFYSHHYVVMNLLKDPVLAVFLVFCSKVPLLQISAAVIITGMFFFFEAKYLPSLKKEENFKNIVSSAIYMLTNLMFLVLHFTEGNLTEAQKDGFIGWPLIVLIILLIGTNYSISVRAAYLGIKKRCQKKSKN